MKNLKPVESMVGSLGVTPDYYTAPEVENVLIADRLNTHKAVVELLEGMKLDLSKGGNQYGSGHNQALTDAIQKVGELFGEIKN